MAASSATKQASGFPSWILFLPHQLRGRLPWNHRHDPLGLVPGEGFGNVIVRYMQ